MMSELINPAEGSKMSILNLFFQMLTNAQRRKPALCLALTPFSPILPYFKCSQNAQIKNPKSTSSQLKKKPQKSSPLPTRRKYFPSPLYKGGLRGVVFWQAGIPNPDSKNIKFCIDMCQIILYYIK